MGAITQAMARECEARGVVLMVDAAVARVRINEAGSADGVVLADGREISARCVVANVGPKVLVEQMLEPAVFERSPELSDFRQRIASYRCGSATFRMNVALSELPDFTALPGKQQQAHHGAGILFAPDLQYMERAFFDAKAHTSNAGWSREPIVELNISSTLDDTLAPAGQHVASLFCQHFDPALREAWDTHKAAAADSIISVVEHYAPNFRSSILGMQVLSPMDLERTFNLTGGDIFHGALQLNQLWSARPVLGYGNYRLPLKGLYLCGSGAHPGGGVTGVPGWNAGREILKDARRGRW
jgi:phytoene dehydrogenase-like protein